MSLKDLELKPFYSNAQVDILRSVVGPLLRNSSFYYRAVGYFSSSWISLILNDIEYFCSNNGKMYILTSIEISAEDAKFIELGDNAKADTVILENIKDYLNSASSQDFKYALNTLAWLIADDILDIRFVLCTSDKGIFHDKLTLFVDDENNMVSLHGSINDSNHATFNGESVSVFKNWTNEGFAYIKEHLSYIHNIYEGNFSFYKPYKISDAIRDEILKYRTYSRPYKKDRPFNKIHIPSYISKLKDYQKEAILSLKDNNWTGLLNMATGTGKTITSLSSVLKFYDENGVFPLIILAPTKYLLWQWNSIVQDFGFTNIVVCSSDFKWDKKLRKSILNYKIGLSNYDNLVIIASYDSLLNDYFFKNVLMLNGKWILICDECHKIGAPKIKESIQGLSFLKKIGLSATPLRWFDEDGTTFVNSFFEKTVFSYSLEEAIENEYLTPYIYNIELFRLSTGEHRKYKEYSRDIVKLYSMYNKTKDIDLLEKIKHKSIKRKIILSDACNKLESFKSVVLDNVKKNNIKYSLVYCSKKNMSQISSFLNKNNIICCQFTAEESPEERQAIISSFESGKIDVILSMKCLDEGVDIPCIKNAYFLSNTSNPREFVQRRGRVLRKFKDKSYANIYDFIVDPYGYEFSIQQSLVKSDFIRANEFIQTAFNRLESRQKIYSVLKSISMEHFIDRLSYDNHDSENI